MIVDLNVRNSGEEAAIPLKEANTPNLHFNSHVRPDHEQMLEIVFILHPSEVFSNNVVSKHLRETGNRYLKCTPMTTVEHLRRYFTMKLLSDIDKDVLVCIAGMDWKFKFYKSDIAGGFSEIPQDASLLDIRKGYWDIGDPIVVYYSWKILD